MRVTEVELQQQSLQNQRWTDHNKPADLLGLSLLHTNNNGINSSSFLSAAAEEATEIITFIPIIMNTIINETLPQISNAKSHSIIAASAAAAIDSSGTSTGGGSGDYYDNGGGVDGIQIEHNEFRVSVEVGIFLCLAYALIFVLGIIGNSFVVAVVARSPRMRTPTNFFIANLAIADLLVLVVCLPTTLIANLYSSWILGEWICKIVPFLQGVSVSASIDTLIAIATERYLAICHPIKCQISTKNCRLIIFIIWTFSLSITIPWAIFFKLSPLNPESDFLVCTEQWPDPIFGRLYFVVAHLILCYLLPLILITICYALILRRVSKRHIPQEAKNASTELLVQRSKMKVIKMLLLVVVLFAMSWLPLYAIFTRIKLGSQPLSDWEDQLIRTIAPMAQWLGSSNSCINPILYAFFNKKYRLGFKAVLMSRSCCSTLRIEMNKSDSTSRSSNRLNLSSKKSNGYAPTTNVSEITNG